MTTPDDTAARIMVEAAFAGVQLEARGMSIVARPGRMLTPALRERIVANRHALITHLGRRRKAACRAELKAMLVPLVDVDPDRLDAALAAWKGRIDLGRETKELVGDYEGAALEVAHHTVATWPNHLGLPNDKTIEAGTTC